MAIHQDAELVDAATASDDRSPDGNGASGSGGGGGDGGGGGGDSDAAAFAATRTTRWWDVRDPPVAALQLRPATGDVVWPTDGRSRPDVRGGAGYRGWRVA